MIQAMSLRARRSNLHKLVRVCFVAVLLAMTLGVFSAPVAQAAVTIDPKLHPDNAPTITGYKNEPELNIEEARVVLTGRIVGIILGVAGTVAVFFIINNGWWLAASAGKEETVTQHKKGLQWAVIGLVLIILSYSILRFIISLTFKADERVNSPAPAPAAAGAPAAPSGGAFQNTKLERNPQGGLQHNPDL
ncbi:MAG: pilin [Patescibacteria group bacterium]